MSSSHPLHILALMGLLFGPSASAAFAGSSADPMAIAVAVDDFSYLDTSGEPQDQTAVHQARLQAFIAALRRDLDTDQRFHLIRSECTAACAAGAAADDRLHAAAQAGAGILIVGGIHKLSTLVQNAKAVAIDVTSHRMLYQKLFTFRGDNDEAWERAEAFVSQDVRAALTDQPPESSTAAAAPVALAVFDFELVDSSAAAQSTGETATDATGLSEATDTVRQLLAHTGRYRVIDVKASDSDAVKTHTLHECGGCDAQIARQLGADQSFVGVVGRLSRTEYTLSFQIRDTRTGAVVLSADSGLRMGANYSWGRGAARLVRDRLLESEPQQ